VKFLFYCQDDDGKLLQAIREGLDDHHQLFEWTQKEPIPYSEIDAAIAWLPPDNFFDKLDRLTHVYALAAGVDHLLDHPGLPQNVNVVRLRDAGMGEQMAEYALYGALHAQRHMVEFREAQLNLQWRNDITAKSAAQTQIGILGAGALGTIVADRLAINEYPVTCWSRTTRTASTNFQTMHGQSALPEFLSQCDVLICLLPLTDETQGVLSSRLFELLPKGAFLINPGRGGHLVDQDLVEALDSGQLSGALLDVFQLEPLAKDHPFWKHPKVTITPHVAAKSIPGQSADQIIESIRNVERGELPTGQVNRLRGY
jgi:glyoxylate/hydroxypyruvate reductase A